VISNSWESPNNQGIGCNTINVNDTANFIAFLQELRQHPLAAKLTLSAAVGLAPFFDATGRPSTDATGFAKVLDYVIVMDYDVWGNWSSTVGPNAPLNDTCAVPANQQGSAVSAVKAWTDAGMPVNQIVLGVASYGHSFNVPPSNAYMSGAKTLAAYPAFNASNQPLGDAWDNTGSVDICGVYEGSGGTFNLWGLIANGFLTKEGTPADGIYYRYDTCSQTVNMISCPEGRVLVSLLLQPYVYNDTSHVMVSFDNVQSFAAKGEYIKNTKLRGFSMWEAGGDYHDMLLDSIIDAIECP
jgi:chitinase